MNKASKDTFAMKRKALQKVLQFDKILRGSEELEAQLVRLAANIAIKYVEFFILNKHKC